MALGAENVFRIATADKIILTLFAERAIDLHKSKHAFQKMVIEQEPYTFEILQRYFKLMCRRLVRWYGHYALSYIIALSVMYLNSLVNSKYVKNELKVENNVIDALRLSESPGVRIARILPVWWLIFCYGALIECRKPTPDLVDGY
ncbi:hypothetical protein CLF_112330 [Clonorchis sinensis]|uniref:Uncharacterized protein n=1 Tax=Clonorchis sinensis TaxID=79923 RepID=G7YW77_CLOSI|nr:hypothetical protein CLF_112330 [Clonorchis sinensis]